MNETLLNEIQQEAVDGRTDLAGLLRKCRILAQRLGNEDLKKWVVCELDGYSSGDPLPEYRILREAPIIGNYMGPHGTGLTNVQIPFTAIDKKYRDRVIPIHFSQGISELQAQTKNCPDGFIRIAMDQNVRSVIHYNSVASHLVLAEVYRQFSTSVFEGVLGNVRNRILSFTLELEEFAPETGDPLKNLKEEHPREIQNTFNTHIMGSVANMNQAGNYVTQNASIQAGDIDAVCRSLTKMGLSAVEVEDFKVALVSEPVGHEGAWGKKVSGQVAKVIQKAAEGALSVTTNVATGVLTEIVKGYYGV